MSHVKAGGTAKDVHDSPGQRLGVKLFGGAKVKTGQIIVRQWASPTRAGPVLDLAQLYIHAARDSVVNYAPGNSAGLSGRSAPEA